MNNEMVLLGCVLHVPKEDDLKPARAQNALVFQLNSTDLGRFSNVDLHRILLEKGKKFKNIKFAY